jgi:hypothetical protein
MSWMITDAIDDLLSSPVLSNLACNTLCTLAGNMQAQTIPKTQASVKQASGKRQPRVNK